MSQILSKENKILEAELVFPYPDDNQRHAIMKFRKIGQQWICCMSDETLCDFQKIFSTIPTLTDRA